jgi:hypothetical protein
MTCLIPDIFSIIAEYENINKLLDEYPDVFTAEIKRKSYYFTINAYCNNLNRVLDKMENPRRQLYVYFSDESYECMISDFSKFGNVHTLNLNHEIVTDVSKLGNVHTLILSGCTHITDVSMLGNVHTLDLRYCSGAFYMSFILLYFIMISHKMIFYFYNSVIIK